MCKKNVSINEFSQHLTKYIIIASIMRPTIDIQNACFKKIRFKVFSEKWLK